LPTTKLGFQLGFCQLDLLLRLLRREELKGLGGQIWLGSGKRSLRRRRRWRRRRGWWRSHVLMAKQLRVEF